MPRFTHSVVVPNESITAGTVTTYDLPVNPLSHINIVLQCLNAVTEATLANIVATLTQVEVLFKGSSVVSVSGADLYALSRFITGRAPSEDNMVAADNSVRTLCLPIFFGRSPYNAEEAFPASARGSLQLRLTWAATFTALDTVVLLVESIELPEASPTRFLKYTTLTQTPVVGQMDLDLPIGNKIHALMIFGTTAPATTSWTATINDASILADNTQIYYPQIFLEGMRAQMINFVDPYLRAFAAKIATSGDLPLHNWLPFDVNKDGEYILDTAGLASLVFRYTAGDTNPVRAIPVEVLEVTG